MRATLLISILLFLSLSHCLKASDRISNGLIEVIVQKEVGTFTIIDLTTGNIIIQNSSIGFSLRPYIELSELEDVEIETSLPLEYFNNSGAVNNKVLGSDHLPCAFPGGKSLSLISRVENQGVLELQLTLYPDQPFLEIGFSFKNLRDKPVRLCRIDVLKGSSMPDLKIGDRKVLTGNSGWKHTEVSIDRDITSENNVLCFFPDSENQRSLVAGGLTYDDYRKFVSLSEDIMTMYAEDPVGRRIDPGRVYYSNDRFYLNGITDNPFEALEFYGDITREARGINLSYYTFPSVCMWFLSVTHFGADATTENSSVGAVEEMEEIVKSGFLKYAPVAVRLVPDNYEQNNQQGWWDDEHWQMHGRKYRCTVDHHYKEPYETTEKWAGKVRELGGIPLIYFQPGIRSEDYAEAFPDHMLYNKTRKYVLSDGEIVPDPHPIMGDRGIPDLLNPGKTLPGYGKMWAEAYDYTDKDFLAHWMDVNTNLKNGGVQGVFYDYPTRALPVRGGMEDRYSTALKAYCNVFRFANEMMGPHAYLQERLGIGSDATLGHVCSVRTEGDNNVLSQKALTKASVRWYKNRNLVNYDMDGKALVETGYGDNRRELSSVQRRAILTLSYTVSGRLLLTESFKSFSGDVIHDLSRVYPFHSTKLSARPLDVFIADNPSVFDFNISPDWHQVVLHNLNENEREFTISLKGNTATGGMDLDPGKTYYLYDFWNDNFIGIFSGDTPVNQTLTAGEARMISVHKNQENPQWISTNRHLMQGYVDLVKKPVWDPVLKTLSGTSSLIGKETYRITIALNGFKPGKADAEGANTEIKIRNDNPGLADLYINVDENQFVPWKITFDK